MPTGQPHQRAASRTPFVAMVLGVLACAAAVALVTPSTIPLESHEIYVVQTAIEMQQRGDWIVPYFGGEPRLTKPPLNYWLTAAAAYALNGGDIQPAHGRIPSALGGILMVAATVWLGSRLFTRSVGLTAGLLLTTSTGFLFYTHNARPEMLYAGLCSLATALFAVSWRSKHPRRGLAPFAMWACFGLACLVKGPHIPALLVTGFAVALAIHKPSRPRLLKTLRPLTGLAIAAAIAVPWWLALRAHIGTETLNESQLTGSRFRLSPTNLLDPYYLYRPWGLLVPWVILIPGALLIAARRSRFGFAPRAIGVILLVAVVIMSFGGGKRAYYMLPYAAPAAVLMALALRDLWHRSSNSQPHPTIHKALTAAAVSIAVAQVGVWLAAALGHAPGHAPVSLIAFGIATVASSAWLICLTRSAPPATTAPPSQPPVAHYKRCSTLLACATATLLCSAYSVGLLNSQKRWQRRIAGQLVRTLVPETATLINFRTDTSFAIYYGRHPTQSISKRQHLIDRLTDVPSPVWIQFPSTEAAWLTKQASLTTHATVDRCDTDEDWILATVDRPK